jgi:tryptophan-rich sensory protein
MKLTALIRLVIAFGASFSAALIGSLFTGREALDSWYANLNKPFFNPPGWVFGPVWTTLYALMAVSAFLVWQKGLDTRAVRIALAFFVLQLILNALWTPLFFGAKMPLAAFIEILLLWAAILLTILTFAHVSRLAALLLVPYITWVSFAALLNASIWLLNR